MTIKVDKEQLARAVTAGVLQVGSDQAQRAAKDASLNKGCNAVGEILSAARRDGGRFFAPLYFALHLQ